MRNRFSPLLTTLTAALACIGAVRAEDIDLFVANQNTGPADIPNVLFILDNTANWNTPFAQEKTALQNVFNALPVNADGTAKFRIGVMFTNEPTGGASGQPGGYVRATARPMTTTNKGLYRNMIAALDSNGDAGSGGYSSLVMAEAYRYFASGSVSSGRTYKTDHAGNTTTGASWNTQSVATKTAMQAIYNLTGNALSSSSANTYTSPVTPGSCAKNFIIYISNGPPMDNTAAINGNQSITGSYPMLTTANGGTPIPQFQLSPSGQQDNVSDEWAYFMRKKSPLAVATYAIDIYPSSGGTAGQVPSWSAVLKNMAKQGEGTYVAMANTAAASEIQQAILDALSQIQGVNTVFASVSLPVSANTQGTYLNQVYIGMFRPDAVSRPRWYGNLKQYKMALQNGSLNMVDADNVSLINRNTGFITECARSFWTPAVVDTYWAFSPVANCLISPSYDASNFPDGNVVEKGAESYVLRTDLSRTVKTCSIDITRCQGAAGVTSFDTRNSAITTAALGAANATETTALINWARGLDNLDENSNGNLTEWRPSMHGDIVHSRPVALNFNTSTDTSQAKVWVFYGGNDGVFRMINGDRNNAIGGVAAGQEAWSFVPPEFYGSIKRLRDNSPKISFPGITATPTPMPKSYGMDGVVTAYDVTASRKWIYATMRRGGRAIYAFDATLGTATNPDAVSMNLKWKHGCITNFTSPGVVSSSTATTPIECEADYTGIGQTWGSVKPVVVSGTPLLFVSGGYDTCEDSDPHTCTAATKGNKVYILDADTGARLQTLNTDRAVIADVAIVKDPITAQPTHGYVADLGGNIYRIDLTVGSAGSWTILKIASLGCNTTASCASNRKFMYIPDVVKFRGVNYLLLGSGDREKPLASYTAAYSVTNYFFMVKDNPDDATWLSSQAATCGSNIICLNSLYNLTLGSTPTATDISAKKGWYLGFEPHEQTVTAAITIFGTVYFSTHVPYVALPGQCAANLGKTYAYAVNYTGSSSSKEQMPSIGLPPSPVAGLVTLDDGKTVAFCIGCSAESSLQSKQEVPETKETPNQAKNRVYWYTKQQ